VAAKKCVWSLPDTSWMDKWAFMGGEKRSSQYFPIRTKLLLLPAIRTHCWFNVLCEQTCSGLYGLQTLWHAAYKPVLAGYVFLGWGSRSGSRSGSKIQTRQFNASKNRPKTWPCSTRFFKNRTQAGLTKHTSSKTQPSIQPAGSGHRFNHKAKVLV
jgi:hypothetical protein